MFLGQKKQSHECGNNLVYFGPGIYKRKTKVNRFTTEINRITIKM